MHEMSDRGPTLAGEYVPLRSTLPPEKRSATSGKFAAVQAIPRLEPVIIDDDADPISSGYPSVEISEIDEDTLRTWLNQFQEFQELDDNTQHGVIHSVERYMTEAKRPVSDDELIRYFEHLLAIKNGDSKYTHRRNFQKAANKETYFDFYIQHFPEWDTLDRAEKADLKPDVFYFLTATNVMPSDEEISSFINELHQRKIKKDAVRAQLRNVSEQGVPTAGKQAIQLYMEKLIDENPEIDTDRILSELSHIIFRVAQERMRRHHSESSASNLSKELRLVATILETHDRSLSRIEPQDLRATLPEIPYAKAIATATKRQMDTIPSGPMSKVSSDK